MGLLPVINGVVGMALQLGISDYFIPINGVIDHYRPLLTSGRCPPCKVKEGHINMHFSCEHAEQFGLFLSGINSGAQLI